MKNLLYSFLKQLNRFAGVLKRKKFLGGIAVIAIVLGGYCTLWGSPKTEAKYITGTVRKGTITNTIAATGTIEPVSTVSLSFENSEIIKKIYIKVGDHVSAGQLLAEQEGDNLEAQMIQSMASLKENVAKLELLKKGATEEDIAQAEASLKMAQSAYDLAKSNLDRSKALFDGGAISQADLDSTNNDYVNAEAKLKQAQESLKSLREGNRPEDIEAAAAQMESSSAQLKISEKDLAGTRMVSPLDGIVSEVNGGEGQRATANNNSTSSGTGFIVIISEALQVEAQVNEADIGRLAVGQRAEFTVDAYPDKTFAGKVSSISPQAETVSNVQIYDATIQLDQNQQGLMAGMPTNVNVIVDKKESVLTMSKSAVTYAASHVAVTSASSEGGGGNSGSISGTGTPGTAKENGPKQQAFVLVLDKSGKPVSRQILLGVSDLKNYEVIEGLNEGDTVILGDSGTAGTSTSSKSTNKSSDLSLIPGGGGPPPN